MQAPFWRMHGPAQAVCSRRTNQSEVRCSWATEGQLAVLTGVTGHAPESGRALRCEAASPVNVESACGRTGVFLTWWSLRAGGAAASQNG